MTEEGDSETRENGRFLIIIRAKMNTDLSRIINGIWEHTNVPVKSSKEKKSAAIHNFKKFSKLSIPSISKPTPTPKKIMKNEINKTRKMKGTLKVYL